MSLNVEGYVPLTETRVDKVNVNKQLEENILKRIEELQADPDTDKRCLAIGFTAIQDAFMWINRGIFKPERLKS